MTPDSPPEPFTLSSVLPVAPRPKWPLPVLVAIGTVALLLVGGGVGLYFANRLKQTEPATSPTASPQTAIREAYLNCNQIGEIADKDMTLVLDGRGTDYNSGTVQMVTMDCVFRALNMPTFVRSKIERTRALDGQVSGEWDNFEASWTYHPDAGLNITIHQKS